MDRTIPRQIMQALSVYTTWIGSFPGSANPDPSVILVRRMGWQILINLFAHGGCVCVWLMDF